MPRVHYLNVRLGDCSIIQHGSGHVSVIDVSSAFIPMEKKSYSLSANMSESWKPVPGNFDQKSDPDNPIDYLRKIEVPSIFRFIVTHPDMDHLGGIKDLFTTFSVSNMWDTANTKEIEETSFSTRRKLGEDWKFYKNLRDAKTNTDSDPRRLVYHSGDSYDYFNKDGLKILAPTPALVEIGNKRKDWNDASYVILYKTHGKKILFSGDSEDRTWKHILNHWPKSVSNVDVLIAPHHGRDSGRDYDFLNVVNPTLTIFGNASSDHLAYKPWRNRGLSILTNNQAGYIILDITKDGICVYVKNETYAKALTEKNNWTTFKSDALDAWYLYSV